MGDVDGVSDGDAVGEPFFFRCGEPLALGDCEGDSSGDSLGLGEGDDFFLRRGEPLGLDVEVGEVFFLALGLGEGDSLGVCEGVGVGDFFFAAVAVFFLRCGVGVGVEKIFFSA